MNAVQPVSSAYRPEDLSLETDRWETEFHFTDYFYYAALYFTVSIEWKWAVEVVLDAFCTTIYRQAICGLVYQEFQPLSSDIVEVLSSAVQRPINAEQNCLSLAISKQSNMQYGLSALYGADAMEEDQQGVPEANPQPPLVSSEESPPAQAASPSRAPAESRRQSPERSLLARPAGHQRARSHGQILLQQAVSPLSAEQRLSHLISNINQGNVNSALDILAGLDSGSLCSPVRLDADKPFITPLILALYKEMPQVADALIEKMNGQQLTVKSEDGFTPLMVTVGMEQLEQAAKICEKQTPDQLNTIGADGMTALIMMALYREDTFDELAKRMVQSMSSEQLSAQEDIEGYTALMCACISSDNSTSRHELAVAIVSQSGQQDLHRTSNELKTALDYAYEAGNAELAYLIARKCGATASLRYFQLMCAIACRNTEAVHTHLEAMSANDLNMEDPNQSDPYSMAVKYDMQDVAENIQLKFQSARRQLGSDRGRLRVRIPGSPEQ